MYKLTVGVSNNQTAKHINNHLSLIMTSKALFDGAVKDHNVSIASGQQQLTVVLCTILVNLWTTLAHNVIYAQIQKTYCHSAVSRNCWTPCEYRMQINSIKWFLRNRKSQWHIMEWCCVVRVLMWHRCNWLVYKSIKQSI